MSNLLEAVYNISNLANLTVQDITLGKNRANDLGEGLEAFVKNAFANAFGERDKANRIAKYAAVFSYEGGTRNPPDLMLKGGDAVEVKKVESLSNMLQLNSSYPKAKLSADSSLISKHCKEAEEGNWKQKDFVYVIGHIPPKSKNKNNKLTSLWFIDGSIYAADKTIYSSLKKDLTTNIEAIPGIDFSPTKELGRVNAADPLKITNLRIRGMWFMYPPYKVFDYVHEYDDQKNFQCILLLPKDKYHRFPKESRAKIETSTSITSKEVKVQNPNNPADLVTCFLIKYTVD